MKRISPEPILADERCLIAWPDLWKLPQKQFLRIHLVHFKVFPDRLPNNLLRPNRIISQATLRLGNKPPFLASVVRSETGEIMMELNTPLDDILHQAYLPLWYSPIFFQTIHFDVFQAYKRALSQPAPLAQQGGNDYVPN